MKGVPVKVAFGEYVVPPVSLRMHFDHEAELDVIRNKDANPKEWTRAAIAFLLAVLARNYPDITEEQFLERVSQTDLATLIVAATNQSGYTKGPLDSPSASPEATSSAISSTQPAGTPTTSLTG